jgi:WD40 repeat protein/Flp pilus assembly protein TadD
MFQGERTWISGTVAAQALENYLGTGLENPQLPQMPTQIAQLLQHCFRSNPDERPHNMLEVAHELQEIYQQTTGDTYPRQQPNPGKDIADSFNNRAVSLLDLGKESEALQLWEQALSLQPHHPESTYNRGLILWRSARINDDVLVRDMEQVRQSYKGNWVADYLLALVNLERDDCRAAIETLESIQGEGAQQQEVKAALEFARERLPNSWGLSTINYLQLMFPYLNDGLVCDPAEFAPSSEGYNLKLWEVATSRCLCSLEGHTNTVNSSYVTMDRQFVVSRAHDHTIKLWEVATGRCLHTLRDKYAVPMKGGLGTNIPPIADFSFTYQSNYCKTPYLAPIILSQVLVTEAVLSINLTYEREIKQAKAALNRGDYVVTAQHIRKARSQPGYSRSEEALNAWTSLYVHLPRKAFLGAWESITFAGYPERVERVCLSTDSRFALLRTSNGTLVLWEVATGNRLRTFGGNANRLGAVCLSADSGFALSYSDSMLKLWEVATGRCLRTFKGHAELVDALCFSADNRFVLSGSYDNTLKLWEVTTGRCLRTFKGHIAPVTSVCLSADSRFALSGSNDNTLKLWEVATGRCLRTFKGHRNSVNIVGVDHVDDEKVIRRMSFDGVSSVCLSADSRFALSGSHDNTLKLWEVATGRCLRTFEGHTSSVSSVCLSGDSRFALSGSHDKTMRLWEVDTGRCLQTFEGHTNWVNSVFLSADGRIAISTSLDKTLKMWVLDWELEDQLLADWDEGARPYLENFLTLHTPYATTLAENHDPSEEEITLALTRRGTPTCTEEDFQNLLYTLGCAGYGWLRPEGVRQQLEGMASQPIFTNISDSLLTPSSSELIAGNTRFELSDLQATEDLTIATQANLNDAIAYFQQSDLRFKMGDLQGGIEDLNRAIQLDSNYFEAYYNRGFILSQSGDLRGALEDFNQAIQLNPNDAVAYYNRSDVRFKLGDLQGAIEDFNQTIQLDSKYVAAYYYRGVIRSELGNLQEAIEDFNRAIQLDSKYIEAYCRRGYFRFKLGDLQGAIEDFNQAIQLNPNDAVVYCHRSNVRSELGDLQGTIEDLTRAIKIDSKYVLAYSNRGAARLKFGDLQGAIEDFNQAIQLDYNCAFAYFNRSKVRSELSDSQGASADLHKAAELFQIQGDMANYQRVMEILRQF